MKQIPFEEIMTMAKEGLKYLEMGQVGKGPSEQRHEYIEKGKELTLPLLRRDAPAKYKIEVKEILHRICDLV